MTPIRGMRRRPRRAWIEETDPGGRAAPGGSPGGSEAVVKRCGSGGRFGACLVGGREDPLQLAVDLGRQRVGIREGEETIDLGARRLDLVVTFLEELVVGAAVGELREEHGTGLEAVQRLLEPEEVLPRPGLLD